MMSQIIMQIPCSLLGYVNIACSCACCGSRFGDMCGDVVLRLVCVEVLTRV